MSRKIDLLFFIRKNRIDLKHFCEINSISSYEELKNHCDQKKLICVEESFYYDVFPPKINKVAQKKNIENVKKNTEKTTAKTRRSSRARKTRKTGPTDKKDDT